MAKRQPRKPGFTLVPKGFAYPPRAITKELHEHLLAAGKIHHHKPEALIPMHLTNGFVQGPSPAEENSDAD